MSMLAERKVKQKWSLNPRGKAWSEDSNKFGQKLLEKMGWSHGKGLGAREDGVVDHVKVAYKNDSKGMGFKENDDQWTQHHDGFNALLQSLSQDSAPLDNTKKIVSLEQKSQSSRVRVHYKKFTRGKDLSRATEKDLANIFGHKSKRIAPSVTDPVVPENTPVEKSFQINSGSMVDYFKNKLLSSKSVDIECNSESESEVRVGFGFQATPTKRKNAPPLACASPMKRLKVPDSPPQGVSNPAFDPMSLENKVVVDKHHLEPIAEEGEFDLTNNVDSAKNSKKNKRRNKDEQINPTFDNNDISTGLDYDPSYEVPRCTKKAKKSRTIDTFDNLTFGVSNEVQVSTFDPKFEVKRSKKSKTIDTFDNPTFGGSNEVQVSTFDPKFEVKRSKKKSRKADKAVEGFDNPTSDATIGEVEVKRKKKSAFDNPTLDTETHTDDTYNPDFEVTRPPPLQLEPITCDLMLNITSTPAPVKPESNRSQKNKRRNNNKHHKDPDYLKRRSEIFEINSQVIEQSLKEARLSLKIDGLEAEIDNDLNEARTMLKCVGEVSSDVGEHEKLEQGTRLKFKYANFGRTPGYVNKQAVSLSKSSYKHLIKGDIVVGFKNTNLHEIGGYAAVKARD